MLEDPNIQHLISWSTTNESFIMSPSSDFSKVLSCVRPVVMMMMMMMVLMWGGAR